MSLEPPEKLRSLQGKLYDKAKAEPGYRFYLLYDKLYRADILAHAYALARHNAGAPGVDGETFERIEAAGVGDWLAGVADALRTRRYRAEPVRRVMIAKPGGGERPLGIPTIRDRVVQTAAKLVLEPIFEAEFDASAYGYRPRRSAQGAVQAVHRALCDGYTEVVDADLSKYFDTIPHQELWSAKNPSQPPFPERSGRRSERAFHAAIPVVVPFLDRRLEPQLDQPQHMPVDNTTGH